MNESQEQGSDVGGSTLQSALLGMLSLSQSDFTHTQPLTNISVPKNDDSMAEPQSLYATSPLTPPGSPPEEMVRKAIGVQSEFLQPFGSALAQFSPNQTHFHSPIPSTTAFSMKNMNQNSDYSDLLAQSSNDQAAFSRNRSEKRPIPDAQKDEKYFERRARNNMAAKKSRDIRKVREQQVAGRAHWFERENAVLRAQVQTLREEANSLRQLLHSHQQLNEAVKMQGMQQQFLQNSSLTIQ